MRLRPHQVVAWGALLLAAMGSALPARAGAESTFVALPILLRLAGVGWSYGAAVGLRDALGGQADLYAGGTAGAVQGFGGVASELPVGADWLGLSLFAIGVTRAEFDTAYRRGITRDRAIGQEVSGHGLGAIADARFLDRRLRFTAGIAQSKVVLEDFTDGSGRSIPLPGAQFTGIDSTHKIAAMAYDGTGGTGGADSAVRPRAGYRLGLSAITAEGRAGQSDTLTTSYRGTGFLGIGGTLVWALHATGSDASVIRRETRYDTAGEVRDALEIDCDAVTDSAARAKCERLEAELSAYIAANNRFGTAAPLGGSTTLRAYRELRFRAAHTRLISTELRWELAEALGIETLQADGRGLELVPFAEAGYAADTAGALYDTVRSAYGLSLRLFFAGVPIRLSAANGDEGAAWFLTAGSAW